MALDSAVESPFEDLEYVLPEDLVAPASAHPADVAPMSLRDVISHPDVPAPRPPETEEEILQALADSRNLEYVDLDIYPIDPAAVNELKEATARNHSVLAMARDDTGAFIVAISDPDDVVATDDVAAFLGKDVIYVIAPRSKIIEQIDKLYHEGLDALDVMDLDSEPDQPEDEIEDYDSTVSNPIVNIVKMMFRQAIEKRASDIHIETTKKNLRIRYRIDGELVDMPPQPLGSARKIISRIKIMASMDPAKTRIPQDGRISFPYGKNTADMRVASLPAIHGETVVIRIQDGSNVILDVDKLGFDAGLSETYRGLYEKPSGMILVTGPTGSGKSSTLYATLQEINTPNTNIVTVEDPVEIQLTGITQIQVDSTANSKLTFASVLRSILRMDPDTVFIGEIRDGETAEIAVSASETGHRVFSTLHTNNAASTPQRIIELGVPPVLIASTLTGVLAQRLVRVLCERCKEPYEPTDIDIVAAGWTVEEFYAIPDERNFFRKVGCPACTQTGYKGRVALVELLAVTKEIRDIIIRGASPDEIEKVAEAQGMVPLRTYGLKRAFAGETTIEEVLRKV